MSDFQFYLYSWTVDAIIATELWGALKIIHHPFSWWACLLFVAVATNIFGTYEWAYKRLKDKGMIK